MTETRIKQSFNFTDCKSDDDIKAVIEKDLKYEGIIVDGDEQAEEWFRKYRNVERGDEVTHRDIVNTQVSVWNDEMQGEETYSVRVTEHYTDPGADDYIYSYSIN